MGKYDIYDDKGSRKGEIRDNEFGREGMDIFDDRGSKIGEIKPHYSVSDIGGGGCVLVLVGLVLIIIAIAGPIAYYKMLAEGNFIVHFIVEVVACVVCVNKLRKRDGDFINDFIISMMITGIVSIVELNAEMIITGQLTVGTFFGAVFLSIFVVTPFALISSLIVRFIR